jgi:RNA polymerase sigma factor (sigma-70 family)
VEVSALKHAGIAGHHARSPLLRLQSDERLIALVRRGNHHAFEALVGRYQGRLLAFCRHMLSSREDAEDVLQEVFAAAFNAILADERPINVRPWLYRIARNRSLNHLRKAQAIGVDSMDVHLSEHGLTTADKVHRREEFRLLMTDVGDLPETQRTALLLRELDALSYEQIAEAMETTVPSVKSLLVRARVSLAEAAEARLLTCEEVREELGEVAEGLRRTSAPVRRHLRTCDRCQLFRRQLRHTNRALAAVLPVGPLILFKKMLLAHLGTTAAGAAGGGSAAAGGGAAAAGGGAAAAGAAGTFVQVGAGALASKAVAGIAAAAIVTAGAVEVKHVTHRPQARTAAVAAAATVATAPAASAPAIGQTTAPSAPAAVPPVTAAPAKTVEEKQTERPADTADANQAAEETGVASVKEADDPAAPPAASTDPAATTTPAPATAPAQHEGDTVYLPTATTGTTLPADPHAPAPVTAEPVVPTPAPPAEAPPAEPTFAAEAVGAEEPAAEQAAAQEPAEAPPVEIPPAEAVVPPADAAPPAEEPAPPVEPDPVRDAESSGAPVDAPPADTPPAEAPVATAVADASPAGD